MPATPRSTTSRRAASGFSYALDLDTEVAPEHKGQPEELVSVRLVKGVLVAKRKYSQKVEYTVKNSGEQTKTS